MRWRDHHEGAAGPGRSWLRVVAYYGLALCGFGGLLGPIIGPPDGQCRNAHRAGRFFGVADGRPSGARVSVILPGALALAIIASIDALLCAKLDQSARRA